MLIALDPGTVQTGVILFDGQNVRQAAVLSNEDVLILLDGVEASFCVIEMIASYGMPVGRETFETCVWIGRFVERFGSHRCGRLFRRDVKLHLCGSARAKDPNVWQALLDRFGPGKEKAVGSKKSPGPLFGITSHERAALAVAVCWSDGIRSKVEIENDDPATVASIEVS